MKPSFSKKQHESIRLGFHKYLKPGALAKLRDSKISARSQCNELAMTRMLEAVLSARESSGVARRALDEVPSFRSYGGVQCLKRKKLAAANSVLLIGSRDSDVHVH